MTFQDDLQEIEDALELATHANHRGWSVIDIEQAATHGLAALDRVREHGERYEAALRKLANPTSACKTEEGALFQIEVESIAIAALGESPASTKERP